MVADLAAKLLALVVGNLRTVRARTTIAATGVVSLALGVGAMFLLSVLNTRLIENLDSSSRTRAADIATLASQGPLPAELSLTGQDEALVQVIRDGSVISSTRELQGSAPLPGPTPPVGSSTTSSIDGAPLEDEGATFRVVTSSVSTPQGTLVIRVASDLDTVDKVTDEVRNILVAGLPLLVLVVSATTWVFVGRALRPVETIRHQVAEISATDLHRRVTEPPTADEIGRLATTMNALLGRLESSNERQRRFIGDASHELQSPLATARAELEVALAQSNGDRWRDTARSLLSEQDRMERLVKNLLVLAKGDERTLDQATAGLVDLDEVVLDEAARIRTRTTTSIHTNEVSAAAVRGSPDLLAQMVANLLDNAVRHATSTVTVRLAPDAARAVLTVDDDGPGIPVEDRDRVFERFTRLDAARTRGQGGTGLGLAIVSQIASAHDSTIDIGDSPTGGARFRISLPLA